MILPVTLTLAVQAAVSMSAVAIPVLTPVAAGELGVPPSYVGSFMSLLYLGATVSAPVSGYCIDRFGPIGVRQACLILTALGLGAISICHRIQHHGHDHPGLRGDFDPLADGTLNRTAGGYFYSNTFSPTGTHVML